MEFYDVTCSIATVYSQPLAAIFANPGRKSSWRIIKSFFKFKKAFLKEDDRVDFGSEENKRKKKNEGILGQRIWKELTPVLGRV